MKLAGIGAKAVLPAFIIILFFAGTLWYSQSLPDSSRLTVKTDSSLLALVGQTMGTQYRILLHHSSLSSQPAKDGLEKLISSRLLYLDKSLFSTYSPNSELSRLNQLGAGQSLVVDPELITVLEKAREIHDASKGTFDISIKPLVDLWGFGIGEIQSKVPAQKAIDLAKSKTGMTTFSIRQDNDQGAIDDTGMKRVMKESAVSLDLSAIAKGYAVDQIALLLESQGQKNYLVEIGGEVLASGIHPDGHHWRIGIESPQTGQQSLFQQIRNGQQKIAVATSGSYLNFFTHEGTRYSHTINPRTGWPVAHELISVTVVDSKAMSADAWATALLVHGLEEGMKLANDLQLAAFFIVDSSTGFRAAHSDAFKPYL